MLISKLSYKIDFRKEYRALEKITLFNYELELINMIRQHKNPEKALEIAIEIILGYLAQHESSEIPNSVETRELA